MKVSIETNETKIVIEDEFNSSSDAEKMTNHNERLVSLAYNYIANKELMLRCEDGKLEKVVAK